MSSALRFGVLGATSKNAKKNVLPALAEASNVRLAMVASRDKEKAAELAAQYGAAAGSYEDAVNDPNIDAIYISLPNALHEEWTLKALRAGKHVICEKPAALTYASAKRMAAAAKENGVRLMEGLMFRYHPQHRKVKDLIANGALGDLVRFDACFGFPMPDRNDNLRNKELGGGTLNYMGPYPIYASRMVLAKEPVSVICRMETDPESGVDARADLTLLYPGGVVAFASTIFGSYFQSTYSVLGSKANVRMGRAYAVPPLMGTTIFLESNDLTEEIAVEPHDHFRTMLDAFAAEVGKGAASTEDYEGDLLAQARVLEAARRSAAEGRAVAISEIE